MSKLSTKLAINNLIIFGSFLIINLLLLSFPLTNVIGFDFSVVNGIFLGFFGGLLFIILNGESVNDKNKFFGVIKEFKIPFVTLPLIPLIFALFSTYFIQRCPVDNGIWFYIIIPLVSYVFGLALAYFSVCVANAYGWILFILLFLLFLFSWLPEIYFNPQIYFYNPLIGFYPGTIYDEDISITFTLVLYRSLILLFSVLIVFSGRYLLYTSLLKRITGFFIFLLIFTGFYFVKPSLGFSTNSDRLFNNLNGKLTTKNFTIIFSGNISSKKIKRLALMHEFYFQKLSAQLKTESLGKIDSYIFTDGKQKRELFGADRADVAKPWLKQIYLNQSDIDDVLKHELTHVFSSKFGTTPFKLSHNFNPALLEGFAMAIENNYQDYPIHYLAALAIQNDFNVSIEKLFSGFNFFGNASSLSYIIAGSFIKYLINTYGIEPVKDVYSDGDFLSHFDKSIEQLSQEYYIFIKGYRVPENKNIADYYFGRKPIFKKYCARYAAKQIKLAGKLYQNGFFNQSRKIFQIVFNKTNSATALNGLIRSLMKLRLYNESLSLLEKYINNFEGTAYYYNLELLYGDNLILVNQFNKAKRVYTKLVRQSPTYQYKTIANLRLLLYKNNVKTLHDYLKASEFDKYKILNGFFKLSGNPQVIATLSYLSSFLKESYKEFKIKVKGNLNLYDETSAYSIYKLANYAFENSDYVWSKKLYSKLLNGRFLKVFKTSIKEKIEMINWILINADKQEKQFVFTYK